MGKQYNLSAFSALIADGDGHAVELVCGMLRGMGLTRHTLASSGAQAMELAGGKTQFDLILCEAELPDMPGCEFVSWLRRLPDGAARFTPVVVLAGHTPLSNINALRDSGAHGIIKKPVSPAGLFDRIVWAADSTRPFVDTPTYAGPDRRFRNVPPVDGVWRRATDLTAKVGEASEPNMSQDEVDSFMKPMRISLE